MTFTSPATARPPVSLSERTKKIEWKVEEMWARARRRRWNCHRALFNPPLPHTRTFHCFCILCTDSADRLITAKDHASVQITVADVDADGKAIKGQGTTIALCGQVRSQGEADDVSTARG